MLDLIVVAVAVVITLVLLRFMFGGETTPRGPRCTCLRNRGLPPLHGGYRAAPPCPVHPPGRPRSAVAPVPVSDRPKEPTYEETEAALIDTLQAAEYRIPYTVPDRWPVPENLRNKEMSISAQRAYYELRGIPYEEVCSFDGTVLLLAARKPEYEAVCLTCGQQGIHTHAVTGVGTLSNPYRVT